MNQLFCKENSIVFINNQEPLPDWCQLVYILNFTKKKRGNQIKRQPQCRYTILIGTTRTSGFILRIFLIISRTTLQPQPTNVFLCRIGISKASENVLESLYHFPLRLQPFPELSGKPPVRHYVYLGKQRHITTSYLIFPGLPGVPKLYSQHSYKILAENRKSTGVLRQQKP